MKRYISIISSAFLITTVLNAAETSSQSTVEALNQKLIEMQKEMEKLQKQLKNMMKKQKKSDKKLKRISKKLNEVKAHDAFDNVKFNIDFRTAIDNLSYDYNYYK